MSTTRGVKLPDGTVVVKGNAQQTNRITCMGCQGEAHVITSTTGRRIYQCINCGRQWSATKF
jgi:hypothetical protein